MVELVNQRYELRRELARGGQSVVWIAFDRQLGREVAFKLPLPGRDGKVEASAEARFLQEARITARLDHPNIITVHEIGRTDDGRLFCAQRLVQGDADGRAGTLGVEMRAATTLAQRLALLPRLLDVSNAVAFAHQAGVVHRDLKPDNVVLGRLGETVVLDWGLSRVLDQAEGATTGSINTTGTLDGEVLGTPLYMSPEQARGERARVGMRSDVWSLGVILYELLSGTTPFRGPTLIELLAQVRTAPVPHIDADVPRALAAIASRALERDQESRYPDAGALAADLRAFLEGRTVGAHDYSAMELVRLFVSRNRTAAAVSAVSVGVLLIAVVALATSVKQNRESLAEAYVEKGRLAEGLLRWEEAAVWFAAAREMSGREDAAAGLRAAWPRTQQESRILFGHTGPVHALASSPDGLTLYSAGADGTIRVWNVANGKTVRVLDGHTHTINALALNADGATLFSGGEDELVRRWNTRTGETEVVTQLPDAVNSLALSPDGKTLAVACEDRSVRLLDVDSRVLRPLGVHLHPVYAVAFSPDGALVASGSWDGEIHVRRTQTGELVTALRGHTGAVLSLKFNAAGTELASAGRDTTLRLWPVGRWQEVRALTGNAQKIYAVAWADEGDLIASAGSDGTSRIWAGSDNRPMPGASLGRDDELLATVFLHGTKVLATGGRRGLISLRSVFGVPSLGMDVSQLSELDDGRIALQHGYRVAFSSPDLRTTTFVPPLDEVAGLIPEWSSIVSRDGKLAVGSDRADMVSFFDLEGARSLAKISVHLGEIEQLVFSPDESYLVTAGKDGRTVVWNTATRDVRVSLPLVKDGLFGADLSRDGKWLATAGYDRKVRVYDTSTWQLVRTLEGHENGVRTVKFSGDSRLIATGSYDSSVRLWRADDGSPVGVLLGHQDVVRSVAFSPDSRRLASSSNDGSIRLWDVETLAEVMRLTPDEGRANVVRFSRDGRRLYYARQVLHRFDLVDGQGLPGDLREVLSATDLSMEGLRLKWKPLER